MKQLAKYLLALYGLFFINLNYAQNYTLNVYSNKLIGKTNLVIHNLKCADKKMALLEVEKQLKLYQTQGYLLASLDSLHEDSLHLNAYLNVGEPFISGRLRIGNLNPNLASKLGISEKLYLNQYFNQIQVLKTFEKILRYYENIGYPFASVKLDSVQINKNDISGAFQVEKNKFFKIDSIRIVGSSNTNKHFLYRYLGIKENMPYREETYKNISGKIKQLPFLKEMKEQRVQLSDRTNKLILFLDKKNASQFDGIVGLLPDALTKKTLVTGDVKLKIINGVFKNGETFDLQWRRLKSQTQDFSGRIIYPYFLGTPIGADYALKIYRRDTTFIDIQNNIGLQYYFSGLNNFKVFYKQRNSNLISTNGLDFLTTLPEYADINTQAYGMALFFENLDYRFNPKKGNSVHLSIQTGNRYIQKNPKLNQTVYNGLLLRSAQYQFESQVAHYFNIKGKHVLKTALSAAAVFGNSTIYRNELLRIGGLRTLRGFDEESIFASTFLIPTLEYRYVFEPNSFLLLFAEGAWYENNSNHGYLNDTPLSIGAGINIETKAGILSLNYALGNQFNTGFDARNGKIHFGLTALF